MNELIEQFARKVAKTYDDLILEMLAAYGIDIHDLSTENLARVCRVTTGWNDHWYIDGVYAFSICQTNELVEPSEDDSGYKYIVSCKVEIIEEMKGQRVWI